MHFERQDSPQKEERMTKRKRALSQNNEEYKEAPRLMVSAASRANSVEDEDRAA